MLLLIEFLEKKLYLEHFSCCTTFFCKFKAIQPYSRGVVVDCFS